MIGRGGALALALLAACSRGAPLEPRRPATATGPLHALAANPRYFAGPAGHVVYLAGSHTWSDFQDYGFADPPPAFDYRGFLDSLVADNHNFFRLWRWEQASWQTETARGYHFAPQPYPRTGPDSALDGKPKFDLTRFDQSYFDRLRARVQDAGRRGIYVSVMLFNGWSVAPLGAAAANPWRGHPYNRANNINGIDGDPDGDGAGTEVHSLRVPAVVSLEERYVAKVIETVGDLDNVLFEIANESAPASAEWQVHMIRFIKAQEAGRPSRHPVGMTALGDDAALWAGPADWISPSSQTGDMLAPPAMDGRKVVLWDTDHFCGLCGDRTIPWAAFLRGANPVFMDPFDSTAGVMDVKLGASYHAQDRSWVETRRNLGYTLTLATRLGDALARMRPEPGLASSGFCLASTGPDARFLVYLPDRNPVSIDLTGVPGPLRAEWLNPKTGRVVTGASISGGARRLVRSPFLRDAVLYLRTGRASEP